MTDRRLIVVAAVWWTLSLAIVWSVLRLKSAKPVLDALRDTLPAVRQYAAASGYQDAVTAFYWFFLSTMPIASIYYFRFNSLIRPMRPLAQIIMALFAMGGVLCMSIGLNVEPTNIRSYQRALNLLLTTSWWGSSLMFLLICHVFLFAIVCITKAQGRRLS